MGNGKGNAVLVGSVVLGVLVIGGGALYSQLRSRGTASAPEGGFVPAESRGDGGSQARAQGQLPPRTGRTPLHDAAGKVDPELVKRLLMEGAKVDGRDEKGRTALHVAAGLARTEVVKALLSAGADPNVPTDDGATPLHAAAINIFGRQFQTTMTIGEGSTKKSVDLGGGLNLDTVKALLKAGADVNATQEHGMTPLHFAAADPGGADVVKALVDAGADVSAKAENGATPLTIAVMQGGSVDTVNVLTGAGAAEGGKE